MLFGPKAGHERGQPTGMLVKIPANPQRMWQHASAAGVSPGVPESSANVPKPADGSTSDAGNGRNGPSWPDREGMRLEVVRGLLWAAVPTTASGGAGLEIQRCKATILKEFGKLDSYLRNKDWLSSIGWEPVTSGKSDCLIKT